MSNSGIAGQPEDVSVNIAGLKFCPWLSDLPEPCYRPRKMPNWGVIPVRPKKDGDEILVSGSIAITADAKPFEVNGRKFGDFRGCFLSDQTDQLETIRKNSVRLNGGDILL